MTLVEILDRFGGTPVEMDSLGAFPKWAMDFFKHDPRVVDPYVELTFQWEVTAAEEVYRRSFAQAPGASFTAYLIWNLARALEKHPCFNYRFLEGKWYHLKHPPILCPVAVGGADRIRDVYLEKTAEKKWPDFAAEYRRRIDDAKAGREENIGNVHGWSVATICGNLPGLSFTALKGHKVSIYSGHSWFYFGRRYDLEGKRLLPFYAGLDHANTDPVVLDLLLEDFREFLCDEACHDKG